MTIVGRALHYVFKVGDRANNAFFYRSILGMKVLRHEEFTQGCDAQCNGPYDNRWSKTMVGYGPESNHFVIELTYNYGVKCYEMGNDFGGITIKSKEIIERAKSNNYPIKTEQNCHVLTSPDGYTFFILDEPQPTNADPVVKVTLHSSNLVKSREYWNGLLNMNIIKEEDKSITLTYGQNQAALELKEISQPLDRAKAYGRIAFSVPYNQQPVIDDIIQKNSGKILTPLISLDTPGKATVRVIILADPDDHEICFVDEEGFSQLSQVEENADTQLDKYIKKDPFQEKVLRHEEFPNSCCAQSNGPFNNRWSKTMVGYGQECTYFAIDLTYNYGVKNYEKGNHFDGITIKSKDVIDRAKSKNYPIVKGQNYYILTSPDGYKFFILNEPQPTTTDPIVKVTLHSTNIAQSKCYWGDSLHMNVIKSEPRSITFSYGGDQTSVEFKEILQPLICKRSCSRIAFSVLYQDLLALFNIMKDKGNVLKPVVHLQTPGKVAVRAIFLEDPSGHEISFIDYERFSLLCKLQPNADALLDKFIKEDSSQT